MHTFPQPTETSVCVKLISVLKSLLIQTIKCIGWEIFEDKIRTTVKKTSWLIKAGLFSGVSTESHSWCCCCRHTASMFLFRLWFRAVRTIQNRHNTERFTEAWWEIQHEAFFQTACRVTDCWCPQGLILPAVVSTNLLFSRLLHCHHNKPHKYVLQNYKNVYDSLLWSLLLIYWWVIFISNMLLILAVNLYNT